MAHPVHPIEDRAARSAAVEDLRFTIGLFFALVTLVLLVAAATTSTLPPGAAAVGVNLNLWSALATGAFALLMFLFWFRGRP